MIKFNLDDLKYIFDEMLPTRLEDEELGDYAFRDTRSDGTKIFFSLCRVENTASIVITCASGVCAASITLATCREVRVVDDTIGQRVVEIVWGPAVSHPAKVVLELDGKTILHMVEAKSQ